VIRDMFGTPLTEEQALALKRKKPPTNRTSLVAARLSAGLHPHRGDKLGPAGETCGSCKHHIVRHWAGRYHKCRFGPDSHGPATDLRVRWPACEKWESRAQTARSVTEPAPETQKVTP
jgi:hypothetical protein